MAITIASWNVNSVRLRADQVCRLLAEAQPDILCLQECKAQVEQIPQQRFAELGWRWIVARGEKGYNGVAILSRIPIEDAGHHDFCGRGDARHVAARLPGGVILHNLYIPAGGDVPDPEANPKFAHKLAFLDELADLFRGTPAERRILVGDLNIAPREDDVWNHKALLDVVSHTPVEVEALARAAEAGRWTDVTRAHIPEGRLYSWWSYRARDWAASDRGRRLDHVWASPDLAAAADPAASAILREVRGWERPSDHAPVIARFDLPQG
ncbi:MAG: exodeoxyribonuclease III [Alphaproteobacteria bacterium]|nr:MAG: exodeoxyribonuclease III [Alphaproteobacteria bacterium]